MFEDVTGLLPMQIRAEVAQASVAYSDVACASTKTVDSSYKADNGEDTDTDTDTDTDAEDTDTENNTESDTNTKPLILENATSMDLDVADWVCEDYPEEGAYSGTYTFTTSLPEGYKLSEDVKALEVEVLFDAPQVLDVAEGYTKEGFCTAWEWKNGTLTKKDGETCTHTDCNGYKKPEWNGLISYYEISNAGELYWFADYVNQDNKIASARLMRSITVNKDLTTKILDSDGKVKEGQSVRKWIPIGRAYEKKTSTSSGTVVAGAFRAIFDGAGYTISGIYYSDPGCTYGTGLIGDMCEGTISNLTLKDSYIEDTDTNNKNGRIAGICGLNDEGTITNCINVGGIVKGTKAVGGICGINQGTISSCTNSSKVTGTKSYAGGICGQNAGDKAKISNCTNESDGTINGKDYVGGICGDGGGSIENCENNGGVTGEGESVGGICGSICGSNGSTASESIKNCVNRGGVTGEGEFVGGICGCHKGSGAIVSCKNVDAEVNGKNRVGGICGNVIYFDKQNETVHTLVKECANSGSVTGTGENVGGVCGYLYFCAGITDICNTGIVSGTGSVGGIAGFLIGGNTIQNAYNTGNVTATNSSNAGVIYGKDEKGDATEENCYYLATIKSDGVQDNGGTSMTAEEFSSGKVAWLLNGSDTTGTTWRQNIDSGTKDDYPVLDGEHGTVYQCTPCKGAYSNSQEPKAHDFQKCENDSTKHVCANCEETEAHTPIYTADNSTHTISGECACGIVFGSVTLSAPTGTLTYDGTEKAATVTGSISGVTETPTISYVKVENKTETSLTEDDKPTDAGTYKASITCGSGDHTATVSVTYTIEQATPTIETAPKVEGTIYDLTKKLSTISLTGGTVTGVNNVTLEGQWNWETPDQSLDINKTGYTAKFTPTDTINYETVTCNVTITVEKATPTVTWSDTNKTVYYTGNSISSDKLPALTVKGVGDANDITSNYTNADYSYSYCKYRPGSGGSGEGGIQLPTTGTFTEGLPTELGQYMIKAKVKANGNYKEAETISYLILTIDWLNTAVTATLKDQNDSKLSGSDWWARSVTFTAPSGFAISKDEDGTYTDSFPFDNNGTDTGSDGTSVTYYLKKTDTGEIAKKTQTGIRIDRTAPTFPDEGNYGINIQENRWKSLLSTITFGLAYQNNVEVKVCAKEELSGIAAYYYYIDEAAASDNVMVKTATDLQGVSFEKYECNGSSTVEKVTTLQNVSATKKYVVYAYAVDKAGNRSAYICSNGVVVDDEAPTLTLSTPTKDDETLTDSSATVTLDASEAGTYFYILKKDGEAAPSDMDDFATSSTANGKTTWTAKAGIASGSMVEGNNSLSLTGLDANTKYTLYVAAVDSVGNATASVVSKTFTTLKKMPTITVQPEITGTYGQKPSEMRLVNGKAAYNGSEVEGTWTITDTKKDTDYPTVGGTTAYEVTFTPTDAKYAEVKAEVIPTVAKATPHIVDAPTAAAITYGQTLSSSSLTNGTVQYSASNTQTVEGCFVWKDGSSKPTAKDDSNKTYYTVIFKPTDSANWNEAETKITITVNKADYAPNMPGSTMSVKTSITKVGDVTLLKDWEWQDLDKDTALVVGVPVKATAVYVGADKGNYEKESIEITITRSDCEHVQGDILYTREGESEPNCVNNGLGHRECEKCCDVTEGGIVVPALGHKGGTATCKGKAVCDNCKQEYGSEDPNNHETTEVRGYQAATYTSAGYTGDTYCKDCQIKIKDGTVIPVLKRDDTPAGGGGNNSGTGSSGSSESSTAPTPQPTPATLLPTPAATQNPLLPESSKPTAGNPLIGNATEGDAGDRNKAPFIKGENGKEGWEIIRTETEGTPEGSTVTVDMNGAVVVPSEVLADIQGRDVTLVFDMGNGITWSVNGLGITGEVGDIDFGVTMGAQAGRSIPVEVLNNVTGERYAMNLTLAYEGEFGFTAVLTVNMKAENAGLYANLFYYNPSTGELEFVCCDLIREDGATDLTFTHASDYTIVIDAEPMDGSAKAAEAALEADAGAGNMDGSTDGAGEADNTHGSNAGAGEAGSADGAATTHGEAAWNPLWIILIGAVVIVVGLGVFVIVKKQKEAGEES